MQISNDSISCTILAFVEKSFYKASVQGSDIKIQHLAEYQQKLEKILLNANLQDSLKC